MTYRTFRLRAANGTVDEALAALTAAGEDVVPLGRAVARIDRLLGRNPLAAGESREERWVRVLTEAPLTVEFEVDEAQRLVVVKSAFYRPRPGG